MALNLLPVPRYCVACQHFKLLVEGGDPLHGRCVAPKAPMCHTLAEGDQYVSGSVPDSSRPFASHMRKDAMQCGPQGEWFEAKAGPASE